MPGEKKRRKNKKKKGSSISSPQTVKLFPLILTSEKKRGLECDYCRNDISQVPRVRCAICPDFDLCLECFATTDPSICKIASSSTTNAFTDIGNDPSNGAELSPTVGQFGKKGKESGVTYIQHDETHGYRVADSTRFFMFPSLRGVIPTSQQIEKPQTTSGNDSSSTDCGNIDKSVVEDEASKDKLVNDITSSENEREANQQENNKNSLAVTANKIIKEKKEVKVDNAEISTELNKVVGIEITQEDKCALDDDKREKKDDENTKHNLLNDNEVISSQNKEENQEIQLQQEKDVAEENNSLKNNSEQNNPSNNKEVKNTDAVKGGDYNEQIEVELRETDEIMSEKENKTVNNEIKCDTEFKDSAEEVTPAVKRSKKSVEEENKTVDIESKKKQKKKSVLPEEDKKEDTKVEAIVMTDEPRNMWTVEEDLRLLDAISTLGLGNWADISEIVGSGKNPKRCMERYIDDYLGRYGHILPKYTLVEVSAEEDSKELTHNRNERSLIGTSEVNRKRKWFNRSNQDNNVQFKSNTNKTYRIVETESLPGYDKVWPDYYIPPILGVKAGSDVGRDRSFQAEQAFVKAQSMASSKSAVENIRKEWTTKLNEIGGPKVLPPRLEDFQEMPGSELAGFMPRRGDFDLEWENDAENILAEMEFSANDHPDDRALKIKVIEIYNTKLDEREKRKKFLVDHKLLDYRKRQLEDQMRPPDERDLINRMRLFARFHTPEEHDKFIKDILKAKQLRKDIAKLQMYRRMGIKSLAEAERFELDRNRREAHKSACRQKELEEEQAESTGGDGLRNSSGSTGSSSLWKQYKNSDRKSRKSTYRLQSNNLKDTAQLSNKNDQGCGVEGASYIKNTARSDNDPKGAVASSEGSTQVNDSTATQVGKTSKCNFNVKEYPGYELLSPKEVSLCQRLELQPNNYFEVKRALIQESLTHGLLDKDCNSNHRSIVKIDIEKRKRENVIDFILQSGWIASKPTRDERCFL